MYSTDSLSIKKKNKNELVCSQYKKKNYIRLNFIPEVSLDCMLSGSINIKAIKDMTSMRQQSVQLWRFEWRSEVRVH